MTISEQWSSWRGCCWLFWRRWIGLILITSSTELVVPCNVKIVSLHESLLLCVEPALIEPFKGRLFGCPEEEGIAGHAVHGGDVEADGLHDIPREFPKCEPHEPGCLRHHEPQPAPEFPANHGIHLFVDFRPLLLHLLQLLPPSWLIWVSSGYRNKALNGFCHL